jgi:hypothetical protein
MTRGALVLAMLALSALTGCPKSKETSAGDAGAGQPAASASASASASGSGSATASASASAAATGAPTEWAVKYTITPGTLYIPDGKDWSHTKFKNEPDKYLGAGSLTLTVEPSGRVTGTSEGPPLGEAILDGHREGDALTATVRRKDPGDFGLTGTLDAKIAGDKLEGTMNLADTHAEAVREAKITGAKAEKGAK